MMQLASARAAEPAQKPLPHSHALGLPRLAAVALAVTSVRLWL